MASGCGSWPAAVGCSYEVPTPLDMDSWLKLIAPMALPLQSHSLPGQMLSQLLQWLSNTFLVFREKERKSRPTPNVDLGFKAKSPHKVQGDVLWQQTNAPTATLGILAALSTLL